MKKVIIQRFQTLIGKLIRSLSPQKAKRFLPLTPFLYKKVEFAKRKYFIIRNVKKPKRHPPLPASSQGQTHLSPRLRLAYPWTEHQRFMARLKFCPFFVRKKTRAHIRDSHAVSFCINIRPLYIYTFSGWENQAKIAFFLPFSR